MSSSIALKKPKVKVAIEREQNIPANVRALRLAIEEVSATGDRILKFRNKCRNR